MYSVFGYYLYTKLNQYRNMDFNFGKMEFNVIFMIWKIIFTNGQIFYCYFSFLT